MAGTLQSPNYVKDIYQHLLFTKDDNKIYDTNISSNVDREITTLAGITNILPDLTVGGDLTVTGNNLKFGNLEKIDNETNGKLKLSANIVEQFVASATDDIIFSFSSATSTPKISMGYDYSGNQFVMNYGTAALDGASAKLKLSNTGNLTIAGNLRVVGGYIYGSAGGAEDLRLADGGVPGDVRVMNDLAVQNGQIDCSTHAMSTYKVSHNGGEAFSIITPLADGTGDTEKPLTLDTRLNRYRLEVNTVRDGAQAAVATLELKGTVENDAQVNNSRVAGIHMYPEFKNDGETVNPFKVLNHSYITFEDHVIHDDFAGGPYMVMEAMQAFEFVMTNDPDVHKALIYDSEIGSYDGAPHTKYSIRVKIGNEYGRIPVYAT